MSERGKGEHIGTDLTQGPVMRSLAVFSGPMILTFLIQQLYSMIDLAIIGHFMGNAGTVSVSVGGELADFVLPLATSFAMSGQTYIAHLIGAKAKEKATAAIGTFITMMMIMSLLSTALIVLSHELALRLLNCPSQAHDQARAYMLITALGMPFMFGYNAFSGILRGFGESKWPLLFIVFSSVIKALLSILLVAVVPLESAGTAIATVVAQAASFFAALVYMYKHRSQIGLEFNLTFFKPHYEQAKAILALGAPLTARSLLVRFSMLWVNSQVNTYGLAVAATNSVGNKLQKLLEAYSHGTCNACAAVIGQNLGAGKHERAKKSVFYAFYSSIAVAAVIVLVIITYPQSLLMIFTSEESVLALGTVYLRIMIPYFFLSATTQSFQSMVIGAGNSTLNFAIGILDGIVCKVGLSLVFVYIMGMGAYGYFWGMSLSRAIPGIICIVYFFSNKWRRSNLTEG